MHSYCTAVRFVPVTTFSYCNSTILITVFRVQRHSIECNSSIFDANLTNKLPLMSSAEYFQCIIKPNIYLSAEMFQNKFNGTQRKMRIIGMLFE